MAETELLMSRMRATAGSIDIRMGASDPIWGSKTAESVMEVLLYGLCRFDWVCLLLF
jgi:hypothetical protein